MVSFLGLCLVVKLGCSIFGYCFVVVSASHFTM